MGLRRALGRRSKQDTNMGPQDPILLVVHGQHLGKRYEIPGAGLLIGSGDTADVSVEQPTVSAEHAELTRTGDEVAIFDKGSRNGTFVNGMPVERAALEHGDRIKVGRTIFLFLCDGVERCCTEELDWLMTHDGLTKLYNKRAFRENLEMELKRCQRYGRELSVFIYGVDGLEATIGEMASDSLLVQVTEVVDEFLSRAEDHARYGDEEFAVLLPEVNQAEALVRAERLREAVGQTEFVWLDKLVEVTISIGVATFEKEMENAQDFIDKIDKNLYQSTKAGRNRVIGVEGGVTRCS
jgi:two-component system cell cycle response regulator